MQLIRKTPLKFCPSNFDTLFAMLLLLLSIQLTGSSFIDTFPYKIYPEVNTERPMLPSPMFDHDGNEYVVAVTQENQYAIISVTLNNEGRMCPQLLVDSLDFPYLVKAGLHSQKSLSKLQTITGRALSDITELARPNGLSQDGFMAEDEDILSVLTGDNNLVKELGLTHPQLAKPLFHVLNMIDADLKFKRWNMSRHRWDNIIYFYYNDQVVHVTAEDTKGGQQSIFDDGITGGFFIKLWRALEDDEMNYLKKKYGDLNKEEFKVLTERLCTIRTGEIEPQYIMRYGFYEGHTSWRADPIALSFIFGIRTLEELNKLVDEDLYNALTRHYVNGNERTYNF